METRSRSSNLRRMPTLVFGLWLTAATIAASTVTAWHSLALPDTAVPAQIVNPTGQWRVKHYLSSECACSRAVARYLGSRGPVKTASEDIILIATDPVTPEKIRWQNEVAASLIASRFHTREISATAAADEAKVEAVPLLEIDGPDGRVRFRGGYREPTTPAGVYLDTTILSGLLAGLSESASLPAPRVFGCATSARLRRQLNPFAIDLRKFLHLS